MNKYLLTTLFGCCLTLSLSAQSAEKVRIRLKNNGLWPREFKFVTYQPGDRYRDVFTTYLLPGATHSVEYKVGTSIAQVNQAEINQIMKGANVSGKPLIVLKPENRDQTIKLIQ